MHALPVMLDLCNGYQQHLQFSKLAFILSATYFANLLCVSDINLLDCYHVSEFNSYENMKQFKKS